MKSKILTSISNKAISGGFVDEEDKEIYLYGLEKLLFSTLGLITSMIVGFAMDMLLETIIYISSYIILRSYAGGYHAKTEARCYMLSTSLIVLALITISYIYDYPRICIAVLAISTLIIMKLAPVEAKNKPLDTMEVIVYRRKAVTILWILILIALTLLFLDFHIYFGSIVVAIICVSIMLILGKYFTME